MEEDSVTGGHSQKEWRERFMTTVLQSENEKSTHFNVLTKDKYQQLINEVETAANKDKKTPLQQRRLKRFGVIDIGGVKKLVAAGEGLRKQAKKMKSHSDKSHPPANIGDNVMIPIPDVDKSKVDLRNIIGVVIDITDEGLYKIGTKHGILQTLYCR
ncbi:hypothetical protein J6590_067122 [Homalodisca vitripennis]|nr:hypothetical protein J6590_067122 [Homalodisca vitripennis]